MHSAFWSSADIQTLSDDGKLLALYLLSCSHGTIAGACRLPDGYVSEDLKWTSGRVSKGFEELLSKGFANRCETTKWVWIRKFLQWNAPENPNQWKAVWKVIGQIPGQCIWRSDFLSILAKITGKEPPPESNPCETVSEPFRNLNSISTATASQQKEDSELSTASTSELQVSRGTSVAEQEVFDHWKRVWNHPLAVFDTKRRARIRARLKEFTVDQLRDCISGFRNSPWHCGTDPKGGGKVYDALDTLLRDTAQVEEGIRLLHNPPRAPPKAESAMERILRANSPDNSRVIEHDPQFRALTG